MELEQRSCQACGESVSLLLCRNATLSLVPGTVVVSLEVEKLREEKQCGACKPGTSKRVWVAEEGAAKRTLRMVRRRHLGRPSMGPRECQPRPCGHRRLRRLGDGCWSQERDWTGRHARGPTSTDEQALEPQNPLKRRESPILLWDSQPRHKMTVIQRDHGYNSALALSTGDRPQCTPAGKKEVARAAVRRGRRRSFRIRSREAGVRRPRGRQRR